jgi:DNA repair protein RecO (recombination protein O)
MQWTDEGIILGTRRHGEQSLIVELMTAGRGRHLGLVKGGRSRRLQPLLQAGNSVTATWRARLDDHLGNYVLEPSTHRAARLMEGAAEIFALQVLTGLLRLLPERDPHPRLYAALGVILDGMEEPLLTAELLVRFEVEMLNELGFGLDLTCCAATGAAGDLVYVSPRSGRAVSRTAGAPYGDRLLALPSFLLGREAGKGPSPGDLLAGFRLTGFFLARHVYEPRGLAEPPARQPFLSLVGRLAEPAATLL